MKKLVTPRSKVLDELSKNVEEMTGLKVGSEEYLNATKANNQLAESAQKLRMDWLPWVTLVVNTGLVVVTIVASQNSIIDTRPVTFVKGLFGKR